MEKVDLRRGPLLLRQGLRRAKATALALGGGALLVLVPTFLPGYFLHLSILIGLTAVVTIGCSLLIHQAEQITLGQGAFYGVGAYAAALLALHTSSPFLLTLLLSGLATAVFGYLIGLTAIRLRLDYLAMATLAFHIIFLTVASEWMSVTNGVNGLGPLPQPRIFGWRVAGLAPYYYLTLTLLFITYFFGHNLIRSAAGRALRAIKHSEVVAQVSGIHVVDYKLKLFTVTAFFTGVAGALLAFYIGHVAPPSFPLMLSFVVLAMAVVGGRNLTGALLGTAFFVLLPEALRYMAGLEFLPLLLQRWLGQYAYHLIITGVLLYLIVIFLPQGLVSLFAPWRRRQRYE